MTARLARSILVIVWATLIAGGVVAYMATRSALLADLDARLIDRACSLPETSGCIEAAPRVEEAAGDRYLVADHINRTLGRLTSAAQPALRPAVLRAESSRLGDGSPVRTLTLQFTRRDNGQPVKVVYSGPAERLAEILNRLALALSVFGGLAGLAAAGVATWVSRAALKPLRSTADAIGQIDDSHLDRRVTASELPVELHPVADRLNDMLARLEESQRRRKQFLADASHELRTPVAALITTIEVALRRPREHSELLQALRTCLSDATMLQQLVQTLLQHARGETRLSAQPAQVFDLTSLLDQCADVAEGLAPARNVRIVRDYPVSLIVRSKPILLRTVIVNLLANAIEYNRDGGTATLSARAIGHDLELSIKDTGIGIAPEHLSRIFEPFYRAGSSREEEGMVEKHHMGLGLFLVDSHVKLLGGKMDVISQISIGTEFTVKIYEVVESEPTVVREAVA